MNTSRVLYITNYPSPYRIEFFNQLGKFVDLVVLFSERTDEQKHRHSSWFDENYSNFQAVFLRNSITIKHKRLCLEIVDFLKQPWDFIISGGYSEFTQMYAFEWMKRKGIPFYLEMDGGLIKDDNRIKRTIKKHFISMPTGWFSSGKATNEYLQYYGAKEDCVYFYPFTSLTKEDIHNARLLIEKGKKSIRDELHIQEEKVVISVGRFSYRNGYGKGYDVLLEVAKGMPNNTGIYIVGDEPTQEFISLKEKNDLQNVHFVGFKNKSELQRYYCASDLFILLTREDVWGLVVNEAMACGLPIITTNRCGAGLNLITEDNGYIVSIEDKQNIIDKVLQLLCNQEKRIRVSENNLRKIDDYTIENMVEIHLEIINRANGKKLQNNKEI